MIFPVFQREKCINYFCMIPKLIHRRPAIVAFLSEPVKGRPPKVGGCPLPPVLNLRTAYGFVSKCVPCADWCVPRFGLVRSLFRITVFLVANWCVPYCEIFIMGQTAALRVPCHTRKD